jgi:hypothetical protein
MNALVAGAARAKLSVASTFRKHLYTLVAILTWVNQEPESVLHTTENRYKLNQSYP